MLDDDDLTFYAPRNQNYLACNFFFPFVLIVSNVSLGLFCVTTKFLTLKDLLKSISYLVSLADVSYIKNDEEDLQCQRNVKLIKCQASQTASHFPTTPSSKK